VKFSHQKFQLQYFYFALYVNFLEYVDVNFSKNTEFTYDITACMTGKNLKKFVVVGVCIYIFFLIKVPFQRTQSLIYKVKTHCVGT
jgi:hypothetical protein